MRDLTAKGRQWHEINLALNSADIILKIAKGTFMPIKRDKFDFEIGYLAESPCRYCIHRKKLPDCSEKCRLMDAVRGILARGISCSGTYYT